MLVVTTGPPVPSRIPTVPLAGLFNVRDFGAVGDGTTDDTVAIQAAINAATPSAGTVFVPPGIYLLSQPLLIKPSTAADSLAPSLIGVGPGGLTETDSLSATILQPSSSFPAGEYLVAYLPYSAAYQLIGYELANLAILCSGPSGTALAAGVGILNARQAHVHDLAISGTVVPAPVKTATGTDIGAFNVHQSGSPGGFSAFDRVTVSHSGQDSFWCVSQESVWSQCRSISAARFGFNVGNAAMSLIGCSDDSATSGQVNDNNSSAKYVGFNSFDGPTNGPTVQLNGSSRPTFIGCQFWGPQATGLNDNSGAIVNTYGGGSADFIGCRFHANANTVHLASAQAGFTGVLRIVGGSTVGTYTGATFLDDGAGILAVKDLDGYNPVGSVTVAIPASGTAVAAVPYDMYLYITASTSTVAVNVTDAAGTSQTVATIPASAYAPVFIPAGSSWSLTYTTAPTALTAQGL
jgi:hypothetical protein